MIDLVLVPTPRELEIVYQFLDSQRGWNATRDDVYVMHCGLGAIAAAAVAGRRIASLQPSRVILVGIAGTFDADVAPVGQALQFQSVRCDGIGVGCEENFQSAETLGWDPLDGVPWDEPGLNEPSPEELFREADDPEPLVGDVLPLAGMTADAVSTERRLLSVCSASADFDQARSRRRMYPDAIAEDMEGYGVALACHLSSTPLHIIRGISNCVGDRNHEHWKIEAALKDAAGLTWDLLSSPH